MNNEQYCFWFQYEAENVFDLSDEEGTEDMFFFLILQLIFPTLLTHREMWWMEKIRRATFEFLQKMKNFFFFSNIWDEGIKRVKFNLTHFKKKKRQTASPIFCSIPIPNP